MSFTNFPSTAEGLTLQRWETFEPYFDDLQNRELAPESLRTWLFDWSQLSRLVWEAEAILYFTKAINTADTEAEQAYLDFVSDVQPRALVADQALKERFLALEPEELDFDDLALAVRKMRNQADLFHEDSVPLKTELAKLANEYDKITGAMTADWDGEEKNLSQLRVFLQDRDPAVRQRAWRQIMSLWLADRDRLNQVYMAMLELRRQVAANAGLPDFRSYVFRDMNRFDYGPEDCLMFHQAIEEVVVPAARRIYEKKQQRLGVPSLRPWDEEVDTSGAPPLQPYTGQDDLVQHTLNIFQTVDRELAHYYATMADEGLLDLDTRPGKALGGYCESFALRRLPLIFMNGAGTHDDVVTMLHEAGHAFHVFETAELPYIWQVDPPMEFAEVASMSMELLAAPYLTSDQGGFYDKSEAARARIKHLEDIILFLPYMAVVDAFQHWVYTHPEEAADPHNCDAAWGDLWDRFMSAVDYADLQDERVTGWHRKPHIFGAPFYYIEYGMAQVGALQVWRNAQRDQAGAVAAYRRALGAGGTKSLPELFAMAGAEFRFDVPMLSELVTLVEDELAKLEGQVNQPA